jgi:YegS/Rv2252/BmrU family lipid kinase
VDLNWHLFWKKIRFATSMPGEICVIFNPTARGDKARRLVSALQAKNREVEWFPSPGPGRAGDIAREAIRKGYQTIVAAGGDGTVNEVLNGISLMLPEKPGIRFGVLPMGTINVFARELQLPMEAEANWKWITLGHTINIDIPFVDFSLKGEKVRRYFAQLAGAGLDARAIELVNWELKKRVGPLAYIWAGIQALSGLNYRIHVSNGVAQATGQLALVGNGKLYGGNFKIFPQADLQDGVLTACVFEKVGVESLARFSTWCLNQKGPIPGVRYLKGPRLTLVSDSRTPLEVDGDCIGDLPGEFGISPHKLQVIVPKPIG